jgi:hypothetical protein
MATKERGKIRIEVDPIALKDLRATLRLLPQEASQELRDKAQPLSQSLARELSVAAAFSAAPPQAILVARSISTPRDRMIRVDIGGSKKVGRPYGGERDTRGKTRNRQAAPAGALLWGSEYGGTGRPTDDAGRTMGNRFVKGRNKRGYWINPTVDANIKPVADAYVAIVKDIVRRLKLEGGA